MWPIESPVWCYQDECWKNDAGGGTKVTGFVQSAEENVQVLSSDT